MGDKKGRVLRTQLLEIHVGMEETKNTHLIRSYKLLATHCRIT